MSGIRNMWGLVLTYVSAPSRPAVRVLQTRR